MTEPLRVHARAILHAGVAAADPRDAVVRALAWNEGRLRIAEEREVAPEGRVILLAAGKAAVGMARGAFDVLGDRIDGALVTMPHGAGAAIERTEVWEAAHPVPDTHGLAAASEAMRLARSAGAGDLVLCLLSGGASALWPAPVPGVALSEMQALTRDLLRSGAAIEEINTVRKHLSRIAGGGLARAAAPAEVVTLAISDVPGDSLAAIGSGPTVPDPTTYEDALAILLDRGVHVPPSAGRWLQAGIAGEVAETAKAEDPIFARTSAHVIARNGDALRAAATEAERLGYAVRTVADSLRGEARDAGDSVARLAREAREEANRPTAILLGGETTVTVRGSAPGGRNQELALAAAVGIDGIDRVLIASLATDGVDGTTDAAGGFADGGTVRRGAMRGLDARAALAANDAHRFLGASSDLILTGATGTNVNDLVLILIA